MIRFTRRMVTATTRSMVRSTIRRCLRMATAMGRRRLLARRHIRRCLRMALPTGTPTAIGAMAGDIGIGSLELSAKS